MGQTPQELFEAQARARLDEERQRLMQSQALVDASRPIIHAAEGRLIEAHLGLVVIIKLKNDEWIHIRHKDGRVVFECSLVNYTEAVDSVNGRALIKAVLARC